MKVPFDNVRNITIKLEKKGIIRGGEKARNKTFYLDRLIDLLSQ